MSGIAGEPAQDLRQTGDVALGCRHQVRGAQGTSGIAPHVEDHIYKSFPQRIQIGFGFERTHLEAGPARLGHVDVQADFAQAAFAYELHQVFGIVEQALSVGHQHRHRAGVVGITHDFDQLVGAPGTPVRVDDITAGYLQSATRTDQSAIGEDLLAHIVQCG